MPIQSTVLANPKAERIRRAADLASRKARERSGRFLIEGPQSVREVLTWHPDIVSDLYVAATDRSDDAPFINSVVAQLAGKAMQSGIYVHKATADVIAKISTDAQGVVAIGDIETLRRDMSDEASGIAADRNDEQAISVAAFWQVRDPGNAGTVIRSADAAGCDAVIFVDDCVDVLNPKVIRSTAGSLFHLPVISMDTDEFFAWAKNRQCDVYAADVYGTETHQPESLPDVLADGEALRKGRIVLFGNEARGLPAEILDKTNRIVSIPIYGKAESLNLGTSAAVMLLSMAMSSHIGRM